jgi:hypothetical protein
MANEVHPTTESGIASLVTGITGDFQQLVREEVALMRQEIQEDIHKTKEAVIALAVGAAAAGVSLILIGFTAVYVLAAISALPLWSSFATATTVLMIVAAGLFFMGKQNLASFRPQREPASASLPRTQPRP